MILALRIYFAVCAIIYIAYIVISVVPFMFHRATGAKYIAVDAANILYSIMALIFLAVIACIPIVNIIAIKVAYEVALEMIAS